MRGIWRWLSGRRRDGSGAEEFLVQLERIWSDERGVGVHGWVLSRSQRTQPVELWVGGSRATITSWHERPEVLAAHPGLHAWNGRCGFSAYVPGRSQCIRHDVQIRTNGEVRSAKLSYSRDVTGSPASPTIPEGGGLFDHFVELANRQKFRVLEIGSRVVCAGSASRRRLFPNATSYAGFDLYADANTDVVGDAHRLHSYFPAGTQFDGIFSLSVLEHLAMPWVVAMEINRLLPTGGHTFHMTHLSWPLHELPWDFWRFTHEGLKVLFSESLGFEIVDVGLFDPVRLHPEVVRAETVILPFERGYGGVAVLARKVRDVDQAKIRWDVPLSSVVGPGSSYPKPRGAVSSSS